MGKEEEGEFIIGIKSIGGRDSQDLGSIFHRATYKTIIVPIEMFGGVEEANFGNLEIHMEIKEHGY